MSSQRGCFLLLSAITALVMFSWAMYTRVKVEERIGRDAHASGVDFISVRASNGADSMSVGDNTTIERMEAAQLLYQDIVALDEPKFIISSDFKFPHPTVFQPTVKILESDWVQQLKAYLLSIHPARSLTITVATKSFIPNLLNWLIAAHILVEPPMEHVLVLALDKEVHSLLAQRKIPCIHVPSTSVLKRKLMGVESLWMTRLAVLRLINHWGYDVLQLDNDAIPLRNPQALFDDYMDYDIVSSRGSMPLTLSRGPWKLTVCMGAVLLRGTQGVGKISVNVDLIYIILYTEALWNVMQGTEMDTSTDDQVRVNYALYTSNLEWSLSEEPLDDRVIVGASQNSTTRVANLPERYICRKTCVPSLLSECYIWHQTRKLLKRPGMGKTQHSQVWFLRSDFYRMSTRVTGVQWLKQLTVPGSMKNIRQRLTSMHTSTHVHTYRQQYNHAPKKLGGENVWKPL